MEVFANLDFITYSTKQPSINSLIELHYLVLIYIENEPQPLG